ncbi:MAG: DUF370 domain-containing protein [Caldicoprobacter oshimai]|uniref:DUF370 domain-containing protein n=1 Tax=Caldicoprobacter faecalis TaxID=937334 RepID=A0A1I5X3D5_9FIRM|nr:extracellular matrix/biofilm biosynthesis regulator RemA family protein [Caldicoprobacter faecalis]PZN11699.1 MAG: DUF370 domain-containing protein [Caldicoprobacter oshimai]SFQ26187.1 protein of unknown function [Caldicoprobacter faecalis]
MILHLGGDVVVSMRNIIAIFDIETINASRINREFLHIAEEEGFVRRISDDEPKTFILAEIDKKSVVFLSPISSSTLLKRSSFIDGIALDSKETEGA